MLTSPRGRSLATEAPAGFVGDAPLPPAAQQPPGLTPGILDAYPGCTPRPRNLPEYQAACRAALGEPVREHPACEIVPDMRVYYSGRFLTVVGIDRHDPHADVELRLTEDDLYVIRVLPTIAPVYALAPTSDACKAPDAGASAGQSTAVTPCL